MIRNGTTCIGLQQRDVQDISRAHLGAYGAVKHAIISLESALARKRYAVGLGPLYLEMRRDMPYGIQGTAVIGVQILVNRNYRPLGSNEPDRGQHAVYEEFPHAHVQLTREQIDTFVMSPGEYHLFNDGNAPWGGRREAQVYLRQLRRLLGCLIPLDAAWTDTAVSSENSKLQL